MSETKLTERFHTFDLETFQKAQTSMIATSDSSYGRAYASQYRDRVRDYT